MTKYLHVNNTHTHTHSHTHSHTHTHTHTHLHTLTHLEAGAVSMCSNNSEPIARSVLTTNSKRYDSGEVIGEEILCNRGGRDREREGEMINFAPVATICTIYHFQTCSLCSLTE